MTLYYPAKYYDDNDQKEGGRCGYSVQSVTYDARHFSIYFSPTNENSLDMNMTNDIDTWKHHYHDCQIEIF